MSEHHSHAHHHTPAHFGRAFLIGIIANATYLIGEIVIGFYTHSMSLIADGEHNFSDVMALSASWLAYHLMKKQPSLHFTYGLGRSTILITVGNACLLMLVTGAVILESCERFFFPQPIIPQPIMITAALGILINGGTALLFMHGSHEDLNIKGAFLHLMSDALIAFSVVISGFLVWMTHYVWIDPLISLIISVIIIYNTWSLLKESLDLALDGVPHHINPQNVKNFLLSIPSVSDIHDLHIWPISTTQTALTVHLVCKQAQLETHGDIRRTIIHGLHENFGIIHPTIQIEMNDCGTHCHLTSSTTNN